MIVVDHVSLDGVDAFVAPASVHTLDLQRVHGAIHDEHSARWLFPAYSPLGEIVLADLAQVLGGPPLLSDAAKRHVAYIESIPALIETRTLPAGFSFITSPYDHQVEGMLRVVHRPRTGLFWDAGTGKSKTVLDAVRAVDPPLTLVLCSRVMLDTWVDECAKHGGSALPAAALEGTPEQKVAIMRAHARYKVIVSTYGTARNMGLPHLQPRTLKRIKLLQELEKLFHAFAGSIGPYRLTDETMKTVASIVMPLIDPDRQIYYVERWILGTPLPQVKREVLAEAALRPQYLYDLPYTMIVIDESHNLQDHQSDQTRVASALASKACRRVELTATPSLGDPRHIYSQLRILAPSLIPEDWYAYCARFLVKSPRNTRIVTGYKNLHILNARMSTIALRLTKEECLDLPPRPDPIDVMVELEPAQRRLYNALVVDMESLLDEWLGSQDDVTGAVSARNAAVLLNKLAQIAGGFVLKDAPIPCDACEYMEMCVEKGVLPYTPRCQVAQHMPEDRLVRLDANAKLTALEERLEELLSEPTRKVIVWAAYRAELDIIEELCKRKGYDPVRLDGSTAHHTRPTIKKFNEDPACRVFVGQVAMGEGITLNAAEYMIYYSLDWSLKSWLQSIDRNYRIGQTKKVLIYRLVARGTIDEFKLLSVKTKRDVSDALTARAACTRCPRVSTCLESDVQLFDPGCVHERNMKRPIAKAKEVVPR